MPDGQQTHRYDSSHARTHAFFFCVCLSRGRYIPLLPATHNQLQVYKPSFAASSSPHRRCNSTVRRCAYPRRPRPSQPRSASSERASQPARKGKPEDGGIERARSPTSIHPFKRRRASRALTCVDGGGGSGCVPVCVIGIKSKTVDSKQEGAEFVSMRK